MEHDQIHSKTCIEAGMRSVRECWHGKERQPSKHESEKGRTAEREREGRDDEGEGGRKR